jgi:c-di-GMP phosphodiesterase
MEIVMSKKLDISILYVEDEDTIRESVARSLSLTVKHVYTAENGEIALEQINKIPVDLIITDIRMPKLDGLSLIEKLRENDMDIPVIITSAFNELEYLNKAIDLNIDKFIHKPIRLNILMRVVDKLAKTIENRRLLREKLDELSRYRKAIEKTNFIMYISPQKELLGINEKFSQFIQEMELDPKEIRSIDNMFSQSDIQSLMDNVLEYKIYSSSVNLKLKDEKFSILLTAFASVTENDTIEEITLLFKDITSVLKDKEALIERLYTDSLTGLPNRQKLFADLLKNEESGIGIIIIDVDGFSKMNHLYGFRTGDSILKQAAEILSEYILKNNECQLYKSDADHFVIFVQNMCTSDCHLLQEMAADMIGLLENHSFTISDDAEIEVTFTIGASCHGGSDLYIEASLALEMAKKMHSEFKCFNNFQGIKLIAEKNLQMQNKIKKALKESKIINYYQPIMDADGVLVEYEALVRMEDPDEQGIILTPYQFLDIARESKNYALLTKQVLGTAFRDFANSDISFSVNLSFADIINPEIVLLLEELIGQHNGGTVTLELLENEGLIDISETVRFCKSMKALGAQIAIDDFGSGYSNFIYFFDIPIDILKIDGSLVKRVGDYRGYLALETIVSFARNIGVKTVAEFVENQEGFEKLKTLGIDMYQGYHFSEPKPFSKL